MTTIHPEGNFFRTDSSAELWQRYCAFLDLSMDRFMEVQRYLLEEQLEHMAGTPIGRAVLGGARPKKLEEFRATAPITTWSDYAPLLGGGREAALGERPFLWCHSAGRGGKFKWVPYTKAGFDTVARHAIGVAILASAEERGDVQLAPGTRVLVNLAPRPYASGTLLHHLADYFPFRTIPSLEEAEEPDFQARTVRAFEQALEEGVDYIFSASPVLVKIAERFAEGSLRPARSGRWASPRSIPRLARAWVRSRLAGRPMQPRDVWTIKGLITFGVDTALHEQEIAESWGRRPYQVYGTTELMISAVQAWNKRALTFLPDVAFWEFIPECEWQRCRVDPVHQPRTLLLNELQAGERYELVLTHFHGMPLLRYRIGDVVKVVALEDTESGVRLPQVLFQSRASDIIDLAGLTQVDEGTLANALGEAGVRCEGWCALKEYRGGDGYLRLLVEPTDDATAEELEQALEERLRAVDVDYRDLEGWLRQTRAVRVTLLPRGAFAGYARELSSLDGSPMTLRPPRINPGDEAVQRLLRVGAGFDGERAEGPRTR